ncbi:MAG: molybdopterin-dependent oxidoreductase [Planctomycetes bacterium]|nr:molybdopterin-dependent oxidoreductase [Planctomycetota bacterium]
MTNPPQLELGGLCAKPLALAYADLARLPADAQVPDVSKVVPGRSGRAVKLAALRALAGERSGAQFLDVQSSDPAFAVSVPIAEVRDAIVVYELDGRPLSPWKGGPFRFLVPGHADECVNVKQLARLVLGAARGRDTRPADDAEHAKLHAKKPS